MIKVIFCSGRYQEAPFSLVRRVAQSAAKIVPKVTGEVEINLVGEAEIQAINRHYRQKNQVTDVLSFAWQEDKQIKTDMLGQIFICLPQIKRQARDFGITVKEEFIRMLAHGLLHLAGYDHITKTQEKTMLARQEKIIKLCL